MFPFNWFLYICLDIKWIFRISEAPLFMYKGFLNNDIGFWNYQLSYINDFPFKLVFLYLGAERSTPTSRLRFRRQCQNSIANHTQMQYLQWKRQRSGKLNLNGRYFGAELYRKEERSGIIKSNGRYFSVELSRKRQRSGKLNLNGRYFGAELHRKL